jgi:hypothetical protein
MNGYIYDSCNKCCDICGSPDAMMTLTMMNPIILQCEVTITAVTNSMNMMNISNAI